MEHIILYHIQSSKHYFGRNHTFSIKHLTDETTCSLEYYSLLKIWSYSENWPKLQFYNLIRKKNLADCLSAVNRYRWKRNGIDLNPSGNDNRFVQLSDEGTIVINAPEDKDEGIFQCIADNNFGISVSINVNFRYISFMDKLYCPSEFNIFVTVVCSWCLKKWLQ